MQSSFGIALVCQEWEIDLSVRAYLLERIHGRFINSCASLEPKVYKCHRHMTSLMCIDWYSMCGNICRKSANNSPVGDLSPS